MQDMLGKAIDGLIKSCSVSEHASRLWACRALAVVRDVYGSDSPTVRCWQAAMDSGCWEEGRGTFDFSERFFRAGLSDPSPSPAAAAHPQPNVQGAIQGDGGGRHVGGGCRPNSTSVA